MAGQVSSVYFASHFCWHCPDDTAKTRGTRLTEWPAGGDLLGRSPSREGQGGMDFGDSRQVCRKDIVNVTPYVFCV